MPSALPLFSTTTTMYKQICCVQTLRDPAEATDCGIITSPVQTAFSFDPPRTSNVYVLLDGDGCVFNLDYIKEGALGGERAAAAIEDGVSEALKSGEKYRLSVYVILNKTGLMGSVLRGPHGGTHISDSLFEDFLRGFQRSHLNVVLNAGTDKESADHRLKALLSAYIRASDTKAIFLGVSHDNGYAHSIKSEVLPVYRRRLWLLQSYSKVEKGIIRLNLPVLYIPGLFKEQGESWESVEPFDLGSTGRHTVRAATHVPGTTTPARLPGPRETRPSNSGKKMQGSTIYKDVTFSKFKCHDPKSKEIWEVYPKPCPDYFLNLKRGCVASEKTAFIRRACGKGMNHPTVNLTEKPPKDGSPWVSDINLDRFEDYTGRYTVCPEVLKGKPCKARASGASGACIYAHTCPHPSPCELLSKDQCAFPPDAHPRDAFAGLKRRLEGNLALAFESANFESTDSVDHLRATLAQMKTDLELRERYSSSAGEPRTKKTRTR